MKTYEDNHYPFQAPDLISLHTLKSLVVGMAFIGLVLLGSAFLGPQPAPTPATRATAAAARPRARRAAAPVPVASERLRQNEVAARQGEVN